VSAGTERDAWLSGLFGCDALRVATEGPGAELRGIAATADAFFYAKVPALRVDLVQRLSAAGFFVVDVNVTLERRGRGEPLPDNAPGVRVRDAGPSDADAVLDIAEHCFRFSRFHLDPMIARPLANKIKREWMASYFAGRRGRKVLLASVGDRAAGFLGILDAGGARVIDLIGVAEAMQGRGVGSALVSQFIGENEHSASVLRVGTQVANAPSLRLYERFGFRVAEATYVMHAHVRAREVVR
jgi:ribosomal protein S18 acetylase RimI-like enzyme